MSVLLWAVCSWAGSASASVDIYVSPAGDDTHPGSRDRPLRTLEAARDTVRTHQKAGEPATIWLTAGRYKQTTPLRLTAKDQRGPLTLRGLQGGEAIISAGLPVPADRFHVVDDEAGLARLHPDARGRVIAAALVETALPDAYPARDRFGMEVLDDWVSLPKVMQPSYSQLAWNGHLLQVACWPNRGYGHISKILDGGPVTRFYAADQVPPGYSYDAPSGGRFTVREAHDQAAWATEFARTRDVLVEGYLHNDWYFQQERIGRITTNEVQLLHHTRYGIEGKPTMIPRRIRLTHLLCELDQPGEWYLDRTAQVLYLWPIAPLTEDVSITLLGGEPLIELDEVRDVTLREITFENGGEVGIRVSGGAGNRIAGCRFRNFMGTGVVINGGTDHGITGCDFYGLFQAATLSGGDRRTLTPCGHFMTNCDIHDCRIKGYGVVSFAGVGMRFAHNLLHDMNGAVWHSMCNDFVAEYNEFYHMGWEMGDWNVLYMGADFSTYGNVIRYNFVHHLMEAPQAYPIIGFRNDDNGAGGQYYGNIFYKAGRGAVAFKGPGNRCWNNIAMHTSYFWHTVRGAVTPEAIAEKWDALTLFETGGRNRGDKEDFIWHAEQIFGPKGWEHPPWSERYPLYKQVMDTGNPWAQTLCRLTHNYQVELRRGVYVHGGTTNDLPDSMALADPVDLDPDEAFVDASVLDFRFKDTFVPMDGFEPILFEQIGLMRDEYRTIVPDKRVYRKAVRERYQGTPSSGGRYNPDTINERYPIPRYR